MIQQLGLAICVFLKTQALVMLMMNLGLNEAGKDVREEAGSTCWRGGVRRWLWELHGPRPRDNEEILSSCPEIM
jgi:hypothetical protein